jgi:hypothetical protein
MKNQQKEEGHQKINYLLYEVISTHKHATL